MGRRGGPSHRARGGVFVKWRLIPRNEAFFDDFVALAREILTAARLLEDMVATDRPILDRATEINDIEHRCDSLTQQILKRLHRTFVTPLDREDIHALALALDDVVDAVDDAALLLRLYHIEEVRRGTRELARIVGEQAGLVVEAMQALEKRVGVEARTAQINRLEHEADGIHRDAVEALFEHERDPIAVIKWKEIFDCLEAATDRCEDIANVLDGIVVKHA
jgi:predicted phosphate transport protein (TIGR00153 family)